MNLNIGDSFQSNNNPGYPPFEYVTNWAEKFDLYDELLKSIEVDNRLFSVISIRQFSNSSIVNFNIDWDTSGLSEHQSRHTFFELFIDEQYDCRMADGTGGNGHFHYNFIVSPPLPDNISGIELIFREYNQPFGDHQTGNDIIIQL